MQGCPSRGLKGSNENPPHKRVGLPEDGVALAKLDLVSLLETDKLPLHKGVVEGVLVRGDKTPSPVNVETFSTWKINISSRRADRRFYPFSCSRDDTVGENALASGQDHQT